jgi:23S rRNA-/tRNA-specific pseudouridylate synthase
LLIVAKTQEESDRLHKLLAEEDSQKMYLARVHGEVKFSEFVVDRPIRCISRKLSKYETCDESDPTGKLAKTRFERVFYDQASDTSVIRCFPLTGRTHQIRLHCLYAGYPIVNDINYGGSFMGNCYLDNIFPQSTEDRDNPELAKRRDNPILHYVQQREMSEYVVFDRTKAMEIFLHSKKYKLGNQEFETEEPYWAAKDFKFAPIFVKKWLEKKATTQICPKCEKKEDHELAKFHPEALKQTVDAQVSSEIPEKKEGLFVGEGDE